MICRVLVFCHNAKARAVGQWCAGEFAVSGHYGFCACVVQWLCKDAISDDVGAWYGLVAVIQFSKQNKINNHM